MKHETISEARSGARDRAATRAGADGAAGTAFAVTLPMRALPRFTPGELVKALNRVLEGTGTRAGLVPELTRQDAGGDQGRVWHRPKEPPRIGVDVAGVTVTVEGHDRPAFGPGAVAALDFPSWPAGLAAVERARGHVRVAEVAPGGGAELDHNHDRAAAVTAVAAAVTLVVMPVAAVWERSGVAVPGDTLEEAVAALAEGGAPVALWIGVSRPGSGATETRGLYPLLGAEIEVRAPALSWDAARAVALAQAAEILETGRPPAEGSEVQCGRGRVLRVRYRAAGAGGVPPAVVLEESHGDGLPLRAGAA